MSAEPMLIFESLYAEIERLNQILVSLNDRVELQHDLITELCNEVEWLAEKARGFGPNRDLLQRAREATR